MFFAEFLAYTNSSPVTLTEKGLYLDVDKLDVKKEIIEPSKKHWDELSQNNKKTKLLMSATARKKLKQKKKSKMISREICLQLFLKCLLKSLKLFQERY